MAVPQEAIIENLTALGGVAPLDSLMKTINFGMSKKAIEDLGIVSVFEGKLGITMVSLPGFENEDAWESQGGKGAYGAVKPLGLTIPARSSPFSAAALQPVN